MFLMFWWASFFIPKNIVAISGEYVFSLSYSNHFSKILQETNWSSFASYTQCTDCWSIHHYSKYFSLIIMGINLIGEKLGFYPLFFYLFLVFSSQLIASYIFLKLIFNKVNTLTLFTVFILIALNNYKVSLFSSGSWYGLTYAILLCYYTIWFYLINNIAKHKRRTLLILGISQGVLASTFVTLTANYFPFTTYSTLILLLLSAKTIIHYPRKFLQFSITAIVTSSLLITPMLIAATNGAVKTSREFLHPVNHESFLTALTIRQWEMLPNLSLKVLSIALFVSLIIMFIRSDYFMDKKQKVWLLLVQGSLIILLMGNKFIYDVYLFIFSTLPLMKTMRSSHRLYMFVIFGYSIMIAIWFLNDKLRLRYKVIWLVLFLITLLPNYELLKSRFTFRKMPDDYFKVYQHFEQLQASKVLYLPAYPPIHKSLVNAYTWSLSDTPVISIYSNPFSTFLPFEGLVSYEMVYYPEHGLEYIMEYNSDKLDRFIKEGGFDFLVVDNYFLWHLYPDFKLNVDKYRLINQIGKIHIYSVK